MATILVVDDSAFDRRLVSGLLAREPSWSLEFAVDGRDALNQLELHLPDVVLTDLQMPEMNGLELVEAVKEQYPLIPVVLMTSQGSEEVATRALELGASSYVPKRTLARDLIENLKLVLSASGEKRHLSRLMLRMSHNDFSFTLENDHTLIPSMVNYLQDAATTMRLCSESDRLRLGVALEEALMNAHYHGNLEISSELRENDLNTYYQLAQTRRQEEPYKGRRIYIDAQLNSEAVTYVIRDEGPGFDWRKLPDPTDPANLERPSGRGLLLIRTFMDEVSYNEEGNQITLVKRSRQKTANDTTTASE